MVKKRKTREKIMFGNKLLKIFAKERETADASWLIGSPNAADVKAVLKNGTLTISGTGKMKDWTNHYDVPWCSDQVGITNVIIEDGVTNIGRIAFAEYCMLTSVTIGNNVESIGEAAFYYCGDLTSITIPNNVTDIGDCAFAECFGLTEIVIGESVTGIGEYVFSGCDNLVRVDFLGRDISIASNAFDYEEQALLKFFSYEEQSLLKFYGYSDNKAVKDYANAYDIPFISFENREG